MGSLIGVPLGIPACGPWFRSHLASLEPFGVLNRTHFLVLFGFLDGVPFLWSLSRVSNWGPHINWAIKLFIHSETNSLHSFFFLFRLAPVSLFCDWLLYFPLIRVLRQKIHPVCGSGTRSSICKRRKIQQIWNCQLILLWKISGMWLSFSTITLAISPDIFVISFFVSTNNYWFLSTLADCKYKIPSDGMWIPQLSWDIYFKKGVCLVIVSLFEKGNHYSELLYSVYPILWCVDSVLLLFNLRFLSLVNFSLTQSDKFMTVFPHHHFCNYLWSNGHARFKLWFPSLILSSKRKMI